MKKLFARFFSAVCISACLVACDRDDVPNVDFASHTDRNFMINASNSNRAEIAAGSIAAARGNDSAVRAYGQLMVQEHTLAQTELELIAAHYNVQLPTGLDSAHRALNQQLQTLSGPAFDSVYMQSQIRDHEAALVLFENEVEFGNSTRVRGYASKYLPHLYLHLVKADSIYNRLNP